MGDGREETTPRVDFLVPGAQKSGTSALRRFLRQHPEIGMTRAAVKEAHYFDMKSAYRGDTEYQAYHGLFPEQDLQKVTGDITPIYMFRPKVLRRAQAYNPDFKIIVMLRQPAERAYSHWAMEYQRGRETADFVEALLQEPYHAAHHPRHRVHSYVQRGFYAEQIRRLYRLFPRDNCLVLLTEDLRHSHAATLRKVYRFLGVSQVDPPKPETVHSRTYPEMPRNLWTLLTRIFEPDIHDLEGLIDRDLSDWTTGGTGTPA